MDSTRFQDSASRQMQLPLNSPDVFPEDVKQQNSKEDHDLRSREDHDLRSSKPENGLNQLPSQTSNLPKPPKTTMIVPPNILQSKPQPAVKPTGSPSKGNQK